jgi:hypothetical protein
VAEENAEFAGFGHEGASHHFEWNSVTGLILSVKRDLSTGKVRRIRGRGVKLDYWAFLIEWFQAKRKKRMNMKHMF